MIHRAILLIHCCILSLCATAQNPFSKWIVQSGDPVNDYFLNHMDLVRLSNGDLLNCTCRDTLGEQNKCRFVRLSPDGDPVQQWEVNAQYIDLNKVVELADGSFACFGSLGYPALFVHLSAAGTVLAAKSYDISGIGIIAPLHWNDAVQDPGGRFTLAGEWGGMSNQAMMARIEADGALITSNVIEIGTANYTFFHSVARMADGDHVFCGASNYPGFHPKTYLFRTDSLLTPQWAKAYPDSGYNYTFARLLVLPGNSFRIILRETDPAFSGGALMVAASSNGTPLWAKRRIPQPDYPNMNLWPKTAQLVNGTTIAVAGTPYTGPYEQFVQLLDTNGDEIAMAEVDIPSPLVGCPGDGSGDFYLAGMNHGPLGVGAYSLGITKLDLDLDLCGEVMHTTGSELWFPSADPAWSNTIVPITVTDELAQFTSYPTTAYPQTICLSTAVYEEEISEPVIAPNPAHERVTIGGALIDRVELLDATGRVLLVQQVGGTRSTDLELGRIAPGLYFVHVRDAGVWSVRALLKE